jgi:hypothetical protein
MVRKFVKVAALRNAIGRLVETRIHPTFPGYLGVLRTAAAEGTISGLKWDYWEFHKTFFFVPGGTAKNPYYRPMWDENTTRHQCWLNKNLAGSYAAKSNPSSPFRSVVSITGFRKQARYSLVKDHWKKAHTHLAFSKKLSAVDVAAFLYRDFCIEKKKGPVTVADLVSIFRYEFGMTDEVRDTGNAEFAHLFTDDGSTADIDAWLEEAP